MGHESRTHGDVDVRVITDTSNQILYKQIILYFTDSCELVKLYPHDKGDCCYLDFYHVGQKNLDFIEFLFNDKSQTNFEYARCREIKREIDKAVLQESGVPYLAPELCLLYKSTDVNREGCRQDFELAWQAMDRERREWLQTALRRLYPQGHEWLQTVD